MAGLRLLFINVIITSALKGYGTHSLSWYGWERSLRSPFEGDKTKKAPALVMHRVSQEKEKGEVLEALYKPLQLGLRLDLCCSAMASSHAATASYATSLKAVTMQTAPCHGAEKLRLLTAARQPCPSTARCLLRAPYLWIQTPARDTKLTSLGTPGPALQQQIIWIESMSVMMKSWATSRRVPLQAAMEIPGSVINPWSSSYRHVNVSRN